MNLQLYSCYFPLNKVTWEMSALSAETDYIAPYPILPSNTGRSYTMT